MTKMRLIRLIEQGEGLWNLVGREIYDPEVGAVLKAAVGGDVETCCPDCGDPGPHETNGDPVEPFLACRACGMHSAVQS